MTARYLLCPGVVRSRTDGDRHHIGPAMLSELYRVPMGDCLVMPEQRPTHHRERMTLLDRVRLGELVALAPREDGDYRLPGSAP